MYSKFEQIDGSHKLKQIENFYVPYRAFIKEKGNVLYFNFPLAKEIGLIPPNHQEELNAALAEKIISTFGLQVINEYDIENKTPIPTERIKDGEYFATRYLQMQHYDTKGRTSGDGRSLWFGEFNGFDFVGRGTGGTALSVGSQLYQKNIQTGDPNYYYASGLAYRSESIHTLFTSEIAHQLNINTERTLAILTYPNQESIIVKTHRNLLRPAHLMAPLRQKNHAQLKKIFNYLIEKEAVQNNYQLIEKLALKMAKHVAYYEANYMFVWIDWDGDNMLLDGGLLDLSTFCKMGASYDEYRIDDIVRWSTTIREQKKKAQIILKNLEQAYHFVETHNYQAQKHFNDTKLQALFQSTYIKFKTLYSLEKWGFNNEQALWLFENKMSKVNELLSALQKIEKAKDEKGYFEDLKGLSWQPLFSRDKLIGHLSMAQSSSEISIKQALIDEQILCPKLEAHYNNLAQKIFNTWMQLINSLPNQSEHLLPQIIFNAQVATKPFLSTGNSDQVIKNYLLELSNVDPKQFQAALNYFIQTQANEFDINNNLPQTPYQKEIIETILKYRSYA